MKVCLVGSGIVQIPPERGGAVERVIQNLAEILSEEHEVVVLDFGEGEEIVERDGYKIHRIELRKTNPFLQRLKFGLKSSMKLAEIDPDVIHLHTVISGFPLALLKSAKIVYTTHNPAWAVDSPGFGNEVMKKFESIVFRRADRVIAVSEYQKKCILEKSGVDPEKVSAIHNFVEVENMETDYEGDPIVLFLGKHTRHKGIHIFTEAVELIRGEIPIRAVSIGSTGRFGEEGDRFWESDEVEFLGAVSEEKKVELLNKASVILCPTDREGHSLVQLEAQATGLPVVATDIPPSKETINEGKTGLFASRNPEDFAEKAIEILKEDWKNTHSEDFNTWMENFSREEISKRWLQFFRGL